MLQAWRPVFIDHSQERRGTTQNTLAVPEHRISSWASKEPAMPVQTSLYDEVGAIRRLCKTQWNLPVSETLTTTPEFYGTVTGSTNNPDPHPIQPVQERIEE